MRRTPTALAIAAIAVLALSACGGDDDTAGVPETTTTTTTTTTTEDAGDDAPPGDEPSALAQEFLDSSGLDIPANEAECVVDGMIDELGVAGLSELEASGTGAGVSDETVESLADVMDACVSRATMLRIMTDQFSATLGDDEGGRCVADALADELTMGDFLRIGIYSESRPDHPSLVGYEDRILAAAAACD